MQTRLFLIQNCPLIPSLRSGQALTLSANGFDRLDPSTLLGTVSLANRKLTASKLTTWGRGELGDSLFLDTSSGPSVLHFVLRLSVEGWEKVRGRVISSAIVFRRN
jgi:hypothetical protein